MVEEKNKIETQNIMSLQEEKKLSIEEMLVKNLQWSQLIYEQNKKIKNRLTLMVITKYIWIVLIAVPTILGFIYLPTLLEQFTKQYSGLLNGITASNSVNSAINLEDVAKMLYAK
ncbi:MAG: hypothetical protein US42_C0007G0017 [Candidatus Magasanikbacteria bacterium GW2011_GWC2_37_14]|uniref:Uncharacterized protein n=1 Tax=Candidatus Magasanikbacteria bacterium GW2011_GWC2_37_14 TaxID=1619046 RepID=A0A0G0JHR3_9BACT|nr:MAG: hypothetical protein US42_C0007G0017 [Candidatus Magasanikbacteria bacterium GW2011_GWC2_37_14]